MAQDAVRHDTELCCKIMLRLNELLTSPGPNGQHTMILRDSATKGLPSTSASCTTERLSMRSFRPTGKGEMR